jgi:hypothetical protein
LLLTWARLIRPGFNTVQGTPILIETLPLLARMRMHAIPGLAALALGGWLALIGAMPWWAMAFPVISDILLMALPVKYTLTDVGIRLGWTSFRRWTEFAGVRRAPGGARLVGSQKTRGMQIWLSGSRGDDEFLQFLRQTVRNAYKGQSSIIPFPGDRSGSIPGGDPEQFHSGVSAYSAEG